MVFSLTPSSRTFGIPRSATAMRLGGERFADVPGGSLDARETRRWAIVGASSKRRFRSLRRRGFFCGRPMPRKTFFRVFPPWGTGVGRADGLMPQENGALFRLSCRRGGALPPFGGVSRAPRGEGHSAFVPTFWDIAPSQHPENLRFGTTSVFLSSEKCARLRTPAEKGGFLPKKKPGALFCVVFCFWNPQNGRAWDLVIHKNAVRQHAGAIIFRSPRFPAGLVLRLAFPHSAFCHRMTPLWPHHLSFRQSHRKGSPLWCFLGSFHFFAF